MVSILRAPTVIPPFCYAVVQTATFEIVSLLFQSVLGYSAVVVFCLSLPIPLTGSASEFIYSCLELPSNVHILFSIDIFDLLVSLHFQKLLIYFCSVDKESYEQTIK